MLPRMALPDAWLPDDDPTLDDASDVLEPSAPKSRSQKKRDAAALGDIGLRLVGMHEAELAALPLDEELRREIQVCRSLTKNARSRQLRLIAKLLREGDAAPLAAALERSSHASREHVAAEREVELWRRRLLEEGDDALTRFIALHPGADRGELRNLVRRAVGASSEITRTRARRELLRAIRTLHPSIPAER